MAGYLFFDNMIFLARAQVFKSIDTNECSKKGGVFWYVIGRFNTDTSSDDWRKGSQQIQPLG